MQNIWWYQLFNENLQNKFHITALIITIHNTTVSTLNAIYSHIYESIDRTFTWRFNTNIPALRSILHMRLGNSYCAADYKRIPQLPSNCSLYSSIPGLRSSYLGTVPRVDFSAGKRLLSVMGRKMKSWQWQNQRNGQPIKLFTVLLLCLPFVYDLHQGDTDEGGAKFLRNVGSYKSHTA
jgi:hypothetical protein